MKLCAVGCLDKQVTIWDLVGERCVVKIDLMKGGIQSINYSDDYQVLLTSGYENIVNIYTIDATYGDSTLVGQLVGHLGMVTALTLIRHSPMVVTADD